MKRLVFFTYTSASESMGIFGLADKWTHIARRKTQQLPFTESIQGV